MVGCVPSAAAFDAVPALRLPAEGTPPRSLDTAMRQLGSDGNWLAHARHLTAKTGVELWVAPDMPCDRTDQRPERVCLLTGSGPPLCATPAQVQRDGAWKRFGQTVAGFAPAGARWAEVRTAGSNDVQLVAVQDGVFGTALATAATDVRFR